MTALAMPRDRGVYYQVLGDVAAAAELLSESDPVASIGAVVDSFAFLISHRGPDGLPLPYSGEWGAFGPTLKRELAAFYRAQAERLEAELVEMLVAALDTIPAGAP